MNHLSFLALPLLFAMATHGQAALPELRVAEDHRHLETKDGNSFFLLGDTAWELFHRLTREETELYLKDRAKKGFNTVLAVALAEFEFDHPNAYGELPLENNDPTKPRDAYFKHVDWVVDKAESMGLYIAMVPTWGDKWNKKWGQGPEIFTPENAAVYGEWLGHRYADKPIIWILGGDRPVENDTHRAIIRAMAAGLKKGDGGRHLITFHPSGTRNSSDYWPDESWLDFHMFQSGHGKQAAANYDMNAKNLALPVLKPTLDGEPNYEDHPVRGLMKDKKATVWFDEYDVRRAAWWSVLSGACGHVYGTHSIWQFHDPEKRKQLTDARTPWQKALDLPGAAQMGVMKKFMEGLDWTKLRRDDAFVTLNSETPALPGNHPAAAVATNKSFAVAYVPSSSRNVLLNAMHLGISADNLQVQAFDPATGGEPLVSTRTSGRSLLVEKVPPEVPPTKPEDMVLVIRRKQR